MLAAALTSFTTFFATVGPVEAAVLFATLTPAMPVADRRKIAVRAVVIASLILGGATLAGGPMLRQLGVTIPALANGGRNHSARDRARHGVRATVERVQAHAVRRG